MAPTLPLFVSSLDTVFLFDDEDVKDVIDIMDFDGGDMVNLISSDEEDDGDIGASYVNGASSSKAAP